MPSHTAMIANKLQKEDTMTVDRCPNTAAWQVSMMISGYRESRRYIGYTKKEAIAEFEMEFGL